MLLDFEVLLEDRLVALSKHDDISDIISKLNYMYITSSCEYIAQYLLGISYCKDIDISLRFMCCKIIIEHTNKFINYSQQGYESVNNLCSYKYNIFIIRENILWYLMGSYKHKFKARKYLIEIINDETIHIKNRYNAILGVENTQLSQKNKNYFIIEGLFHVVFNCINLMYQLMASQYLLKLLHSTESKKYKIYLEKVQLFVVDICLNHEEYNSRADAADILINCNDKYLKQIGEHEITILGSGTDYFTNNQNVHIKSIEKSCEKNLEILMIKVYITQDILISLNEFKELIGEEKYNQLDLAIERIISDRSVYTKYKLTLVSIFCKVYSYIKTSSSKYHLSIRLYEELLDSIGVCSSGFMARIVNCLSGFDDFSVGINFEDQVSAYFTNIVNTKIKLIDNNDLILQEMIDGGGPTLRKFLLKNLSDIRESMFQDFKDYISDVDFDIYFKKAYIKYYD